MYFHRKPANIKTIRNSFFINRTIPLWNDLPVKVKQVKTLNSLGWMGRGCSPPVKLESGK